MLLALLYPSPEKPNYYIGKARGYFIEVEMTKEGYHLHTSMGFAFLYPHGSLHVERRDDHVELHVIDLPVETSPLLDLTNLGLE